jgi:OmpA-OmpF porin, OOP family
MGFVAKIQQSSLHLGVSRMKISPLNKAIFGSAAALAFSAGTAFAGVTPNLLDANGQPVRDGSGNCVQNLNSVTHPNCEPKKVEPPKPAPAPAAPAPATPAPAPKPAPAPAAPQSVRQAITIQADALFDFDKSNLRADGKAKIDEALGKIKGQGIEVEMIIVTGHTDSVGSEAYNQRLSDRRAATVKDYMVSQGIAAGKITTVGKGELQPVATNKTKEGRQKNRRTDIEFKGVTTK